MVVLLREPASQVHALARVNVPSFAWVAALLLGGASCTTPHPRAAPDAPLAPAQAAPRPAAQNWRAEGEICVRLARFEDQESLRIAGARDGDGSLEISRRAGQLLVDGRAVEASGGSRMAAEAWFEARDPQRGLSIGAVQYPGRLRVRLAGPAAASTGLAVDNVVDLEDYVAGVVAREVQLIGAAPAELEAQAIATRSFALAQLAARGTRSLEVRLYDGTRDQAYGGRFVATRDPASMRAAQALWQAVSGTHGMVLREGGATLDARFHAACGGRTADAADVFPEAAHFQALRSVECEACLGPNAAPAGGVIPASAKDLSWRTTLSSAQLERLARALGVGERVAGVEPSRRDRFGRWLEVEVKGSGAGRRVPFEVLRKQIGEGSIGSNLVLSTWPRAGEPIESGWMLSGRGRGHGVGLCQNGSRGRALAGDSAAQILAHYYPGSVLVDGR